jgi:glutathione S-transferase
MAGLAVLYSFRRCPYAMRARLAIRYSKLRVELREVDLKHKPDAMLQASPKATVPVLVCPDQTIIDESLDIMHWSLKQSDPQHWLQSAHKQLTTSLIQQNDSIFKTHLDRYKYAERFPGNTPLHYRQQGEAFLQQLEQQLKQHRYLVSDNASIADIAIMPFVRQFAHVDLKWFETSPYAQLRNWLFQCIESDLFQSIMTKTPCWQATPEHNETTIKLV